MRDTGQRILDAAIQVFGRDGVSGATTREIARMGKVNEVTLFRYFKSKDELLRQAIQQCANRFEDVFAAASVETQADLRHTVQIYAAAYLRMLMENEDFVRTFYGELNRHLNLCQRLFVETGKPKRQKFIDYLRLAQKGGLVRADLDVVATADALTSLLLGAVIRRPLTKSEYEIEPFFKTTLEIFLKGIQP
jgi:AcrR family transcriptional regulator